MANETLTLQFPKLALFFPENYKFVGDWFIVDIGLHPEAVNGANAGYFVTESCDIGRMYRQRDKFAYKNSFGHTLVVAGSCGKYGALLLCCKSCLRSGAGLVSALTDPAGQSALNCMLPEAMAIQQTGLNIEEVLRKFSTVAIGPGMGTDNKAVELLQDILDSGNRPLVLDADALNIVAVNKGLLAKIPANSIITPHVGELERLVGKSENSFERIRKAIELSKTYNIITVLKGANTAIVDTEGKVYFNQTGNPGMATAGSGDVLTGIIAGLLSSGYSPLSSAIMGVWLHGKSGDLALDEQSYESLMASDIISKLGTAFKCIALPKV